MCMQWVRDNYHVPAMRGGRVRYTGDRSPRLGTITGTRHGSLRIRLDGEKHSAPFHPTWELEYLPKSLNSSSPQADSAPRGEDTPSALARDTATAEGVPKLPADAGGSSE